MTRWGGRPAARFRAFILDRDGYRCQMIRDGRVCGDPATTVQHVVALAAGGPAYDPSNAVAACAPCNQREGGRMRAGRRRPPPAQLTPGAAALVQLLDSLGVPFDAGTMHARRKLTEAGHPTATRHLADATAWRTARGPAGAAPPSRLW